MKDGYDLTLTTQTAAARDAYVRASELALTFYPGEVAAYDHAIAADPGFAMAHAGKAQALIRQGEVVAARAALAAAKDLAANVSEREASHIGFFDLVFTGQTEAAIAAMDAHLMAWPRDALVVASATAPNGVIASSGRIGQKRRIAALMDRLAPEYGDDFWFVSYHAMALSEDGRLAAAREKIERSLATNPNKAHGAHGLAHILYESGEQDEALAFLSSWLATYPRDGFFHGHLSWHVSLSEIQAGNGAEALQVYHDAIAHERHSGSPQQKVSDGAALLWRAELAGHPRDASAWRALHEYASSALPRPGNGLADLHVILTQVVMRDEAGLKQRVLQIEAMAKEGRYPSGSYLPALAGGFTAFERGDFAGAIESLAPLAGECQRIGGSHAQHDLIEYTLLQAYLRADRLAEARQLLRARRVQACSIPVLGVAAAS